MSGKNRIFFRKRSFPFFQLWKLMFLFPGSNTSRLIWLMVWVTNYDSKSLLFIQRISKFGNEIYMSFVAVRTGGNVNMKRDFIFLICFRILSAFCRVFIFLNPAYSQTHGGVHVSCSDGINFALFSCSLQKYLSSVLKRQFYI